MIRNTYDYPFLGLQVKMKQEISVYLQHTHRDNSFTAALSFSLAVFFFSFNFLNFTFPACVDFGLKKKKTKRRNYEDFVGTFLSLSFSLCSQI